MTVADITDPLEGMPEPGQIWVREKDGVRVCIRAVHQYGELYDVRWRLVDGQGSGSTWWHNFGKAYEIAYYGIEDIKR